MKQKGTHKEKFTIANIRSDLRKRLWKSWLLLFVYVFVMAMEIYLIHLDPYLLFEESGRRYPGWLYVILVPITGYLLVKEAWWLFTGYRSEPIIVKDTLVSSEGEEAHSTYTWRTYFCTLHFNCYGDYDVPEKNYSWSKEYAMTARGVDNLAFEGDEYYLVLSKPHNGKILLAYNAKLFELESEIV